MHRLDPRRFVRAAWTLVWLVTAIASSAHLALCAPQIHSGVPPVEVQSTSGMSYFQPSAQFRATLMIDCEGKALTLHWRYAPNGDFANPVAATKQVIAVGYWPTVAEVVSSTTVLIAGKERSGDTRLERWIVVPPLVVEPVGGGATALGAQPVGDIEVLYDASVAGKDMIKVMHRVRGKPSSALVQFADSNVLYELNWNAAPFALTQVLTPATEPALSNEYDYFFAGDHITNGFVYVFADFDAHFASPALVLIDANRDGTIDARQTYTFAQYRAAALDARLSYVELRGVAP